MLTAVESRNGRDAAFEMGISESAMRQVVYRARSGVRGAVTAVTAVIPLPCHPAGRSIKLYRRLPPRSVSVPPAAEQPPSSRSSASPAWPPRP